MMRLEIHPLANTFPLMADSEIDGLAADIAANGLHEAITLYEGRVLDGRNRLLACKKSGLEPRFQEYKGNSALQYVVSMNLKRRHLNESQRGMVGARLANMPPGYRTDLEPAANLPEVISEAHAAEMLNVSERTLRSAKMILREAPEMAAEIDAGEVTIGAVLKGRKREHQERRRQENKEKAMECSPDIVESGARFATILIDPPWDCADEGDVNPLGRAKPEYADLTIEELLDPEKVPTARLADDDCHLYLWVTNRTVRKGFDLVEAWGFRYVTMLTWPKPSYGLGSYFRGQTEHILFGVKGSQHLKRSDASTLLPAWKRGPNGHSSKPVEIYEFVESCSPGPYLEMFSRAQEKREDWAYWGADAA